MCGIAGWVDFKNNLSLKYNIIKDMTETLKKRGPDNHGYYIKENVSVILYQKWYFILKKLYQNKQMI